MQCVIGLSLLLVLLADGMLFLSEILYLRVVVAHIRYGWFLIGIPKAKTIMLCLSFEMSCASGPDR